MFSPPELGTDKVLEDDTDARNPYPIPVDEKSSSTRPVWCVVLNKANQCLQPFSCTTHVPSQVVGVEETVLQVAALPHI